MKDCIFCKIVAGEIPCYKIYEDDNVLAFLDIALDCLGHTLVIPKKHFVNVTDCDHNILARVFEATKKISKHYIDNCGFSGVNVVTNVGTQQIVGHLHVHIFPRKPDENLLILFKNGSVKQSLEEQHKELKMF
ncbi:MAG: HIT domain-containing protein [Christensenellaceae bacterium]|jgi:histidine triad (HIT) family protein|nr:HIT domain-containing protein [Christensenellaceae bacterium]